MLSHIGALSRLAGPERRAAIQYDRLGLHAVVSCWACVVLGRTAYRERCFGLALRCTALIVVGLGMSFLAATRPELYARRRELMVLVLFVLAGFTVVDCALHGGSNLMDPHNGSSLALLFFMQFYNGSVWLCIMSLFARMHSAITAVILVAAALPPFVAGRSVCLRIYEVSEVDEPLGRLHTWLWMLHSLPLAPHENILASACDASPLVQQCVAVNRWSLVAIGLALPVWLLCRQERALAGERRRRVGSESWSGSAWGAQGGTESPALSFASLYVSSCAAWFLAYALA